MALFNPFKTSVRPSSFSNIPVQTPFLPIINNQLDSITREKAPKLNEQQFRAMLPALTETHLQNIVAQARLQGISEKEIEDGLVLIENLRTTQ